jgi:hypothetical protein
MNTSQQLITTRIPGRAGSARSALVQAVMGSLAGALAGIAALEAQDFSLLVAVAAGGLVVLAARGDRWTALGGFVLGFGGLIVVTLSPVVNNSDPAVAYAPSTIPALVLSVLLVVLSCLALGMIATRRRRANQH